MDFQYFGIINNNSIHNMLPNHNTALIMQANTAITIETLSPKQILGECIDLATALFK